MNAAPPIIDRVKHNLVGLKTPRALEILEVTLRENRRVRMALQMARLSAVKTLAGFDFACQPSLDKSRVMALAECNLSIAPKPSISSAARRRGGQSRSQRLLRLPRRHHRDAG